MAGRKRSSVNRGKSSSNNGKIQKQSLGHVGHFYSAPAFSADEVEEVGEVRIKSAVTRLSTTCNARTFVRVRRDTHVTARSSQSSASSSPSLS